MRFLGLQGSRDRCQSTIPETGGQRFEATPRGIRVKHRVAGNSIKMYDKQGSVLRVETTINDPRVLRFSVRRKATRRNRNVVAAFARA